MLKPPAYLPPPELDQRIFDATVPADQYPRRGWPAVECERGRCLLAPAYDPDRSRPAREPALPLQLQVLQDHYHLSDRGGLELAHSNMAFRLYRGQGKVLLPGLLPGLVVNVKRVVSLVASGAVGEGAVRAGWAGTG